MSLGILNYNLYLDDCNLITPGTVQKYLNKISGPLLDRINLHVEVTPESFDQIAYNRLNEPSKRVVKALEIQIERFRTFILLML